MSITTPSPDRTQLRAEVFLTFVTVLAADSCRWQLSLLSSAACVRSSALEEGGITA